MRTLVARIIVVGFVVSGLMSACEPESSGIANGPDPDAARSDGSAMGSTGPVGAGNSIDAVESVAPPSKVPSSDDEQGASTPKGDNCPGPIQTCGLGALVNVDVWHRCTVGGGQPAANGFRFTLNTLSGGTNMGSATTGPYYQNPWYAYGTTVTPDPPNSSTTLQWSTSSQATDVLPYGQQSHFGYEVSGDPDHIVTAQWLFGDTPPSTAPGCIATAISTDWHDAEITPARLSAPQLPDSRAVTIAQHSHTTPLRLNASYVVTTTVRLADLDGDWPGLAAATPVVADALMPINQDLRIEIPVEEDDAWIVLVSEWSSSMPGPGRRLPLAVTYHAVR